MFYVLLLVSYLLGSVPFGWLLAKLAGKGDLRKVGSGGTGATNAMRVGGLKMAVAVWFLDMAKAAVAVWIAGPFGGLLAVIGHCWPVWLKFHGGKGISCMFGALLAVSPIAFCATGICWLIVALSSGYSSFGALIAMVLFPVLGFAISFATGIAFLLMAVIGYWRHRDNIRRLLRGTELKIKWKK